MFPRRPRLKTFNYVGRHRYYLTFCTHERRTVFVDAAIVDLVWRQILQTARAYAFSITAHVFMPDHAHFLVNGDRDDADLRKCAAMCKQKSAHAYSERMGGRLWQASFYDHVLRDDETDLFVIRYILENPVRAGLVERWEDYPFAECSPAAGRGAGEGPARVTGLTRAGLKGLRYRRREWQA